MLKGEIIAVSNGDLARTAITFGIVMVCFFFFRKEFLLVSFDRDMAVTLKKNVLLWDGVLFLLIGLAISMAVLSVGPLVTFGVLLWDCLLFLLIGLTISMAVLSVGP